MKYTKSIDNFKSIPSFTKGWFFFPKAPTFYNEKSLSNPFQEVTQVYAPMSRGLLLLLEMLHKAMLKESLDNLLNNNHFSVVGGSYSIVINK